MMDDHTCLLRALLTAVVHLDELPHPRHTGRMLLAAVVAGKSCSDDTVARVATMPVAIVQEPLASMLDRCLHIPTLLTAKKNRTPTGTLFMEIRLTSEGQRRVLCLVDAMIRPKVAGPA